MIVVDASVLTNALTDDGPVGAIGRSALSADTHWAGPEHLIVEAFSAIRGRRLGDKITSQRALDALDVLKDASIDLSPTVPLLDRMWSLRQNLTGYDAAYVALAEGFDCALVTADRRLSEAPGLRCEVVVALPMAS